MAGFSTIRERRPRSNAKSVIDIFNDEDIKAMEKQGVYGGEKGIVISLKRADVEKITTELCDKYSGYERDFIGKYDVYSRDAIMFSSYKELRKFKKEYC
jgi:hypothetical protein